MEDSPHSVTHTHPSYPPQELGPQFWRCAGAGREQRHTAATGMELLSKREGYANYQAASANAKATLLMSLDSASMRNIRAEFKLRDWELDVKTFMRVVLANSHAAGRDMDEQAWALRVGA